MECSVSNKMGLTTHYSSCTFVGQATQKYELEDFLMELENKTALVTGAGAIGGIGFEIATLLVGAGAEVVISGRSAEQGEAAARALGEKARFVLADLSSVEAVGALAD